MSYWLSPSASTRANPLPTSRSDVASYWHAAGDASPYGADWHAMSPAAAMRTVSPVRAWVRAVALTAGPAAERGGAVHPATRSASRTPRAPIARSGRRARTAVIRKTSIEALSRAGSGHPSGAGSMMPSP